jgi:4-amino-4-deoxy-L-arabinose transferase-like glycosyltransferase
LIFYSQETFISLIIAALPAIAGIFVFQRNRKLALFLLLLSAFLIRLLMASLDPFLHEWDEKYHALVAKNMINFPFKPMLRINPILPYDPAAWCCNHIWVHKQPLFLWQMALSMKIFGVNVIAMRLPSVIMGTLMVWLTYDIARFWTKNDKIAFLSGLMVCFSYFQLELISGRLPLEHNDVTFAFYATASIWSFTYFLKNNFSIKWALVTGVFVGCSILVKWLTGLLIFGGWGLYILLNYKNEPILKHLGKLGISFLVACAVFIPWQVFILNAYPVESAISYAHNQLHITEVIGTHYGSIWYHLEHIHQLYAGVLILFFPVGIFTLLRNKEIDVKLTAAFIAMILVVYFFFSVIVATKMPAFTYMVSSLIIIIVASGIITAIEFIMKLILKGKFTNRYSGVSAVLLLIIAFYSLNPMDISAYRSHHNEKRNQIIHNTRIYKSLNNKIPGKYVIFNCKPFEDVDVRFFTNNNAYNWFPEKKVIDSLLKQGYELSAFTDHNGQGLPWYLSKNEEVFIIEEVLE